MESFNDKPTVFHMAWCRTMGEFEMKRNDEKGYKNHHISPSLRKNASSRAMILIHTSSYHSCICRKQVRISFVWLFLKHQVRNIVTPSMATLIVSRVTGILLILRDDHAYNIHLFEKLLYNDYMPGLNGWGNDISMRRWSSPPQTCELLLVVLINENTNRLGNGPGHNNWEPAVSV